MKKAFITGINGMDGSYLADLLLSEGYEVHGLIRRHAVNNGVLQNINHIKNKLHLHTGDMTDIHSLNEIIQIINPDEVYNLAAQSFVGSSWKLPLQTAEVNGIGTVNLLEAVRKYAPDSKFYQASTSEMFGKQITHVANEDTNFHPRSPYGIAKLYAHWMCINYRESYQMHINCGILFNHESERRGSEFVTQKIASGVALIANGKADKLILGNLEAKRDWGYAPEYVHAMWLMLQKDKPGDYVIGTGKVHSVRDFAQKAFKCIGIENYMDYIETDSALIRPAEVDYLRADASKADKELNWEPETDFDRLVEIMVDYQLSLEE